MKFQEKRLCEVIRNEVALALEVHLEKAIEKGVTNALKSFGADADNRYEVQKDFHYLRHLRKHAETSSQMLTRAIISVTIAASAVAFWEGIKILLHKI